MYDVSPLASEKNVFIVKTLNLKGVDPARIDPVEPLFDEGLSLNTIDNLEPTLVIFQQYGYQFQSDDPDDLKVFSSLRSLCESIEKNRTK